MKALSASHLRRVVRQLMNTGKQRLKPKLRQQFAGTRHDEQLRFQQPPKFSSSYLGDLESPDDKSETGLVGTAICMAWRHSAATQGGRMAPLLVANFLTRHPEHSCHTHHIMRVQTISD